MLLAPSQQQQQQNSNRGRLLSPTNGSSSLPKSELGSSSRKIPLRRMERNNNDLLDRKEDEEQDEEEEIRRNNRKSQQKVNWRVMNKKRDKIDWGQRFQQADVNSRKYDLLLAIHFPFNFRHSVPAMHTHFPDRPFLNFKASKSAIQRF